MTDASANSDEDSYLDESFESSNSEADAEENEEQGESEVSTDYSDSESEAELRNFKTNPPDPYEYHSNYDSSDNEDDVIIQQPTSEMDGLNVTVGNAQFSERTLCANSERDNYSIREDLEYIKNYNNEISEEQYEYNEENEVSEELSEESNPEPLVEQEQQVQADEVDFNCDAGQPEFNSSEYVTTPYNPLGNENTQYTRLAQSINCAGYDDENVPEFKTSEGNYREKHITEDKQIYKFTDNNDVIIKTNPNNELQTHYQMDTVLGRLTNIFFDSTDDDNELFDEVASLMHEEKNKQNYIKKTTEEITNRLAEDMLKKGLKKHVKKSFSSVKYEDGSGDAGRSLNESYVDFPSTESCHRQSEQYDTESVLQPNTNIEYQITSQTPTSFNSSEYAGHVDFVPRQSSDKFFYRNLGRKSFSFSNERVREIERQNKILLRKMRSVKPTVTTVANKPSPTISQSRISDPSRQTSAAINRRKQQRQIKLENDKMQRKLYAICNRRPVF